MAATRARASKTKTVNGRVVSAKSKTGDPACSQAMSDWKRTGMTSAIAAILGKCRSSARSKKKADMHEAAGNDGKAAILRRKAENTAPTNAADRLARAKNLQVMRKAGESRGKGLASKWNAPMSAADSKAYQSGEKRGQRALDAAKQVKKAEIARDPSVIAAKRNARMSVVLEKRGVPFAGGDAKKLIGSGAKVTGQIRDKYAGRLKEVRAKQVAQRAEKMAGKAKASPVVAPGRGTAERLSGAKQVREFRAKQGLSGRAAILTNESARQRIASHIPTSASANRLGRGMDKDSIRGARERLMAGDKKFQAGDARMRSFDGRKDRVKQYADNKRNFAANQRNAYFKDDGAVQSLDASKAAETRFSRGISADNKISDTKKRLSAQLNARMVSEARFPKHAAVQPAPVAIKSGPSKLQSLIKAKSAGVVKAGVSRREHRPADRAAILQRATEHRASKGTIATRSATVSSRINDKRNQVIDSAKASGGKLSQSGQDRAGLLFKRDMKVRGFMNRGQFAKLQPKGQPTPQVGWGDSPVKMAVPTSLLTYDNPALKQAKSAPSVPARTGPSRLQSLIKSKSAATVNAGVARRTELAKKGTELAVKPPMTLKEQVAFHRAKKEHMAWAEATKLGRMKYDTPATHGRKHRADDLARRALKVQKTARRKQLAAIKAKKYDVAKHNREAYETNFARKENLFVASGHLQLRAPKEQTGVDQSMTGARWVTAQNVQTVAPAAPAAPATPKGPSKLQSLIKSKSASVVKTGAARVERRAGTLKAAAEFKAKDRRYADPVQEAAYRQSWAATQRARRNDRGDERGISRESLMSYRNASTEDLRSTLKAFESTSRSGGTRSLHKKRIAMTKGILAERDAAHNAKLATARAIPRGTDERKLIASNAKTTRAQGYSTREALMTANTANAVRSGSRSSSEIDKYIKEQSKIASRQFDSPRRGYFDAEKLLADHNRITSAASRRAELAKIAKTLSKQKLPKARVTKTARA